ncbi:unnamed protein product [Lymnaea stagnalis]|uniref:Neurotransmitter-gated ion-channel ligand-binding domain-containing protein n=1 Tax=Lymnaea stagnalis TaxID=6523 RepID=A0AAV2I1Q9_LYMST
MMTVIVYLQWSWAHDDLKWDPAGYEGLERVLMATDSLWVPDVTIVVGQRDSLLLSCPQNLILNSTGVLMCATQTYVTFRCEINFEMYPFDTQECHFGLLYTTLLTDCPVRHRRNDVTINTDNAILITQYITAGEWVLKKSRAEIYQDLNNVSYPRYIFTVQRRSAFYVITIVFPMVLASIMVTLVFLIPANTGEKISYLVSIFTSLAIFLGFIR